MQGKLIGSTVVAVATALALLLTGPGAVAAEGPAGADQVAPAPPERKQVEFALAQG